MRFLLVDDQDVMRRTIERTVAKPGDDIRTAANGLEALAVVDDFDPDVVTMDLSMPEMDGLACIESILRKKPKLRIIVISALKDKPTAVEAIKRGAMGFLLKPFSTEALSNEIRELLV